MDSSGGGVSCTIGVPGERHPRFAHGLNWEDLLTWREAPPSSASWTTAVPRWSKRQRVIPPVKGDAALYVLHAS